jgi:hypothetical protein
MNTHLEREWSPKKRMLQWKNGKGNRKGGCMNSIVGERAKRNLQAIQGGGRH